jgi:CreA protein
MKYKTALLSLLTTMSINASTIAEVKLSTGGFSITKMVNPDKLVVTSLQDPILPGSTCYFTSINIGGIGGAMGLATDPSNTSISCRQTGIIDFKHLNNIPNGEEVYSRNTNIFFKKTHIKRYKDPDTQCLVYLTYSDALIGGSYKNSTSVICPVGN